MKSRAGPLAWLLLTTVALTSLSHAQDERIWIPGWQQAESMTSARAGAAVVLAGGRIYTIGGVDGKRFLASVEWAAIQADGSLSPWHPAASLNEPRGFLDAVAHNNFLYAVGGGNGPGGHNLLRTVERAAINPDGSLGDWQVLDGQLSLPRRCVKLALVGDRLYAFGGFGGSLLDSVEMAQITADGGLDPWRVLGDKLTVPRYVHAAKKTGNSVVLLGGHAEKEGSGIAQVEWAPIEGARPLSRWQQAPALGTGRYGLAAAMGSGFIYALGGLDGVDYLASTEKSPLTAEGKPAAWTPSNPLSSPRANFGALIHHGRIYIIGGTNASGYFDTVEYAAINEHGDFGFWGTKADARQYEAAQGQRQARVQVQLEHAGVIREVIGAGQYTYLRIQTPQGSEWLATSGSGYQAGQHVRYSAGIIMRNFHSKTLERSFDTIRFVSRVDVLSGNLP